MGAPTRADRAREPGTVQPLIAAPTIDPDGTGPPVGDRWLAGELEAVAEIIHAATLTLRAGHRPVVHVRRAAVRLAALDATLDATLDAGTP